MPTSEQAHRVTMRAATPADLPLLGRILCLAADPDGPGLAPAQVQADPDLMGYVAGWARAGDVGVVAEAVDGSLVGAAWARTFGADDRGFGHVSPVVPELAMGVEPAWRGLGWGGAVLDALLSGLRTRGVGSVSLSVRDTHEAARALYDARGFVPVGRSGHAGGSTTMLLVL